MKKVMCFGTFDNLHRGHISYFKQAKKIGDYLIVIIARDKTVKNTKGHLPKQNEKIRLENVKKLSLVDKAVLGYLKNKFKVIEKYRPDVICLGYDQKTDIGKLRKSIKIRKKIVIERLKPYKPYIYKSSKL